MYSGHKKKRNRKTTHDSDLLRKESYCLSVPGMGLKRRVVRAEKIYKRVRFYLH